MSAMRSTVRIDDDLMIELKARAHAESVSLTRILNRTLRAGLARPEPDGARRRPFRQMKEARALAARLKYMKKALARLEDEKVARKLSFRDVHATGERVVILKRGRPVAELSPAGRSNAEYPQTALKGTVTTTGDIIGPVVPEEDWDSLA